MEPIQCLNEEAQASSPPVPSNKANDELIANLAWGIAHPDSEWGYVNRMAELTGKVARSLPPGSTDKSRS